MKLLLVEDEKLLSKSIAKGLTMLGYAVDCAYDGEEALSLYDINEYDLMILDLNLPKLDGMEVLRRIRAQDADFRILILSARNSLDDKITGLDSGSNDYLTKPFEFAELEARIRSLLRRARRGRRILTRVRVIVRTGEEPHDAGECDDDEYGNDKQKAVAWRTCVGGAVRLLSLAALAILIALALAYRPARLRILLALRVA